MLDGLCKAGKLDLATELFEKFPEMGMAPTVCTYSIMINGFCKDGQLEKANNLFIEMEKRGCASDVATFNMLMQGFCNKNDAPKVVELLQKMAERNFLPDAHTATIIVDLLSRDDSHLVYWMALTWIASYPQIHRELIERSKEAVHDPVIEVVTAINGHFCKFSGMLDGVQSPSFPVPTSSHPM